jgi:hypothetical protein
MLTNNAGHVGGSYPAVLLASYAGVHTPNGYDHTAGVVVCIPNNGREPAAASNRAVGNPSRGASC